MCFSATGVLLVGSGTGDKKGPQATVEYYDQIWVPIDWASPSESESSASRYRIRLSLNRRFSERIANDRSKREHRKEIDNDVSRGHES